MKPSERIMEIYQQEIKAHITPQQSLLPQNFGIISTKVYCDSVVQYLDEQAKNSNSTPGLST